MKIKPFQTNKLKTKFIKKQIKKPTTVGKINDSNAHFSLPVSFFTVKTVVEQGQWKSEKISVQTAVLTVQPFAMKIL